MKLVLKLILLIVFLFELKGYAQDKRFILITGCGRSGTHYITEVLKTGGLRVEHESSEGEDGCVSWAMAVHSWRVWPYQEKNDVEFEHVFHQTRDPILVIESYYNLLYHPDRFEWMFVREHIPEINKNDSLLVHCAKYWYYWNLKVEQMAEWRYRIEDLEDLLPEFEKRLGIIIPRDKLGQLPKHESRKGKKITWESLKNKLPSELFSNIKEMAIRYGYLVTDEV